MSLIYVRRRAVWCRYVDADVCFSLPESHIMTIVSLADLHKIEPVQARVQDRTSDTGP